LTYRVALVYFDLMDMKPVSRAMAKRENKRPAIRKIHINLPEELHQKLRVRCALEDMTIQDFVCALIKASVEKVVLPKTRGEK